LPGRTPKKCLVTAKAGMLWVTMPTLHMQPGQHNGNTMATQWQHHGNTMALKNGSQEYILHAIMHQMVPAGFSKDLPLHHLHPTHHWPHEHMRLPLSAMGHGIGCTCLFSMIQSAAGSKLHPLPSCQLC